MSVRRRDLSPPPRGVGGGRASPLGGGSKLRMDRNPSRAKITDPSNPAGKRREIDNVMKKARAFPNETWDKKLLEAEEKDPNRWRHTGYKKMYIEEDPSSSDSDHGGRGGLGGRYGNGRRSRSPRSPRPMHRRSPSPLPPMRKRHISPPSPGPMRRRSPSPSPMGRKPPPMEPKRRPRSPSPPSRMGRKSPMRMLRRPISPGDMRRRSPPPGMGPGSPRRLPRRMSPHLGPASSKGGGGSGGRLPPIPRSKRPPSPPPRMSRSASMSSCSDDSCSACSVDDHRRRRRSRSRSYSHPRPRARSPPHSNGSKGLRREGLAGNHESRLRPMSPPPVDPRRKHPPPPAEPMPKGHRGLEKDIRDRPSRSVPQPSVPEPRSSRRPQTPDSDRAISPPKRSSKHSSKLVNAGPPPEPVKVRSSKQAPPPDAPANGHESAGSSQAASSSNPPGHKKHHKDKGTEKLRARVKIEGEPKQRARPRSPSSGSEESSSSESSLPRFTATTRMTLSERFGKMAQWSVDRSNMENMRITKNSSGGDLKVMIEEDLEAPPPPARYNYSPAPAGHFPEELIMTCPTGMSSWDDVRVRYEYYKGRGYLRDLDLEDYVKWEEWWYKYQEWLKQERYYEMWERTHMGGRRRKKIPITQRLN